MTHIAYFGETTSHNYLVCDGSQYNKVDYPQLWSLLSSLTDSTAYVVDGDNTKFKVPDLRGEFLRGTGTNNHMNQGSGAGDGVHQDATLPNISGYIYAHCYSLQENSYGVFTTSDEGTIVPASQNSNLGRSKLAFDASNSNSVYQNNSEAKPTNTSVVYCIAYKDIYVDARFNYSTEERVVGTWIYSKPLYQKNVSINIEKVTTTEIVTYNVALNVNKIVSINSIQTLLDGSVFESPVARIIELGELRLFNRPTISAWVINISNIMTTIRYIKTTDIKQSYTSN